MVKTTTSQFQKQLDNNDATQVPQIDRNYAVLSGIVCDSIQRQIVDSFGRPIEGAIRFHLQQRGVDFSTVLDDPEKFLEIMEQVFGPASEILSETIFTAACRASELEDPQVVTANTEECARLLNELSEVEMK